MFEERYSGFLNDFGSSRTMVLSTAGNGRVSSRMMSVVLINGCFYFQTDVTMRKYRQLCENPYAALCIDNIQIEGKAEEMGRPCDVPGFMEAFKKCFKGSYDAYTMLKNERVFGIKPIFIQRWLYVDGVPYIEKYYTDEKRYSRERYDGE